MKWNPLAKKLVDLYLPVWTRIEDELPDGVGVGGAEDVQKGDDGKPYSLDDERLYAEAEIRIDQMLLYDLRGDIEANVAQALREYAHELLDGVDRLEGEKSCRGPYLVIERERVLARFDSLAAAGGFTGGYGEHCQIAELVQEVLAAVGKGTEGGAPARRGKSPPAGPEPPPKKRRPCRSYIPSRSVYDFELELHLGEDSGVSLRLSCSRSRFNEHRKCDAGIRGLAGRVRHAESVRPGVQVS